MGAHYDPGIDVAFICTGNICRSPMAEALLRARLAEVAPTVTVGSAGLLFDGREAEYNAVRALAKRGVDVRGHRSQRISVELLAGASLILGMERRHVREVASLDPDLFARSFTLPEVVRSGQLVGARRPDEPLRAWAERVSEHRSPADYVYEDRAGEIADPMGQTLRGFRTCAEAIDARLEQLVALAWPTPTTPRSDRPVARATPGGIHADRDRR